MKTVAKENEREEKRKEQKEKEIEDFYKLFKGSDDLSDQF